MPACTNCGEQNPERARFCLACGSPLAESPPAAPPPVAEEERKHDTLVFVDLVGSTALSEALDPEDVLSLLESYYNSLRAELERCGGTVEKYIGDAVVTHFGVPVAHEDDPERAVRAAFAVLETVTALNAKDPIRQLQVRIGIATGEVIVKHDNRAEEGKGIAWGDVLNTAARIESNAPVMGILVGEATYRATAHAVEYLEREPIVAKGKADPVPVWEAVRLREEQRVRGRHRDAPLVGRVGEIERVLGLWESIRADRRPALATVIGDPGIGKSRLLTELAHRIGDEAAVHWGRCLSYGEGITYWPVVEILESAAGILKSDDTEVVSGKLGTLIEALPTQDLDQLRTMASALANLIGVPRTPHGTYSAAEISKAELHWGIRRVLELLAAEHPLVLVFEDLHWAEPTLFDLIDHIGEAAAPILVIGSARREIEQLRPEYCTDGDRRIVSVLNALGEDESELLLAELLGARELPPGSRAEMLIRNAGGNPLFLEETVRMLAESGVFDGGDLDDLAIPTTVQAMIGSRLDVLPAQEKRVAQHASVVGMVFWSGAVADLHGGGEVDPSLEALERRDFVRAQDDSSVAEEREWSFKHALTRDVSYARVPKGRRAHLHLRFADWISAHPGAGEELIEIVAYHLEQSCKMRSEVDRGGTPPPIERAVEALMKAADKSERREGIREADRYYARAIELVRDDDPSDQLLDLWLGRADTLAKLGELQKADEFLVQVAEKATAAGRSELRAKALIGMSHIATKQGRGAAAAEYVADAESIAGAVGEPQLQIRAAYAASNVHSWIEGNLDAAIEDLRRGLAIAEGLGDKALRLEGHLRLVALFYSLGDLREAEDHLSESSALLGEVGSLRDEARVAWQSALVMYHLGEIDAAERSGLQALEWLERTGETYFQLQNLRTLALCALARSDLELAEERLRRALPIVLEIGGWLVVEIYRCLIDVVIRQDRLSDAGDLALLALEAVPEEDVYARAAAFLIKANLRTAEGDRAAAEEAFVEALGLLEQQRLPLDHCEARLAYGRALCHFGDDARGRTELEATRVHLESMDARGLVDEIDRELARLTEGAGQAGPLASSS